MDQDNIVDEFNSFIGDAGFPCVIAKNIAAKRTIRTMVAGHLACPRNDQAILDFIYNFCTDFHLAPKGFHSVAIIFTNQQPLDEGAFEGLMWERLQELRKKDAQHFKYDSRVSEDPASSQFSFSLMGEAFFVLALHPASSRPARRFKYPVLIFNPHAQFEKMKQTNIYEKVKSIVRKRDLIFSGSVNPMLTDFGDGSEALQYSGKVYEPDWKCPLQTNHTK